jgi:hypothetical protein
VADLASGDLNGDGNGDMVGFFSGGSHLRMTLLGDSSQGFSVFDTIPLTTSPKGLCADFNLDGRDDYLVDGSTYANILELHLSSPTGTLDPGIWISAKPDSLVAADINLDGWPDIVEQYGSTSCAPGLVRTFLNDTVHPFVQLPQPDQDLYGIFTCVGSSPRLYSGDLDHDGDPDFVAVDVNGWPQTSQTRVIWNDGTGRLSLGPVQFTGSGLVVQQLVDYDGDGELDLIFREPGVVLAPTVTFWWCAGDGQGGFGATQPVFAPPHAVAGSGARTYLASLHDLDGDGDQDVIVSSWDGDPGDPTTGLAVYFNCAQ